MLDPFTHFSFDKFDLANYQIEWLDESGIKPDFIQRYQVIPLFKNHHYLYLGMLNPTDISAIEATTFHTGLKIRPQLIEKEQFQEFIKKYCSTTLLNSQLELTLLKTAPPDIFVAPANEDNDEPVIHFVNQLIQNAIDKSTSDIHIEPQENTYRIRFRQDGLLTEITDIPHHLANRVITRLKILAKLNISERRLPQDGRFQQESLDIRLSTCPTLFGEKAVLRLLNVNKINLDFQELGLTSNQINLFLEKLIQPQGLILVTGPTGSGKTLTLYAALKHLNTPEKNISTVEDPVEIKLNGINQVNINPKIHLTFFEVLKTFLRQDPDIIMVGEIRDLETAEIAIHAAQTGHLVLSTLHTNNAIETLMRLQSLGIPSYQLASSISLIIAQRLIRKYCLHCTPSTYPACTKCRQGFLGRTGIFELLPMTSLLANLILSGASQAKIHQYTRAQNFITMQTAGLEKVKLGITCISEIKRVLINEEN